MAKDLHILVVQDNNIRQRSYIDLAKHYYDVKITDLYTVSYEEIAQSALIIMQIDLNDPQLINPLKEFMLTRERRTIPTLFLLHEFSRREVVQANTLGATDYIVYPCPNKNFIQAVEDLLKNTTEKSWSQLTEIQRAALDISLKTIEKSFHNAAKGLEVSQEAVKSSCSLIIDATANHSLNNWMGVIRQHNNQTYRHSMMVCGYLVAFGMVIGVSKHDLQTLAVGGMIHDIGEAKTPLSILEKSSELTPEEIKIYQKHTHDGPLILEKDHWDAAMIDVAAHHHERLDGTGYPDGLKSNEISDIVRMTSIANIFSELTDKRSYRHVMPAEKALETMINMDGYLDIPLVKSFRAVVLSEDHVI